MSHPKAAIAIREIWDAEGTPWPKVANGKPYTEYTVGHHARSLGFVRPKGESRYLRGPCVTCQEVYDREEIGDTYRCPECREYLERMRRGPYHVGRWGEVPRTPEDWMCLEREAHHYRMRQECRRDRISPVHTRMPDSYGGIMPSGSWSSLR